MEAASASSFTFFALWRWAMTDEAFGSSYLQHDSAPLRMDEREATYTLIACKMNPPVPDVFIIGCVRPGSTWYCRRKPSVRLGPKYPGKSRSFTCKSERIWTCGLCTTIDAEPPKYGYSRSSIDHGSYWLAITSLRVKSV